MFISLFRDEIYEISLESSLSTHNIHLRREWVPSNPKMNLPKATQQLKAAVRRELQPIVAYVAMTAWRLRTASFSISAFQSNLQMALYQAYDLNGFLIDRIPETDSSTSRIS